ncbi:MAG TPA: hypothetical protein VFM88_20570 [Vicinamibacteria bacterium]|nr:hypothetical protein [Vicinamibacteria bacterium]
MTGRRRPEWARRVSDRRQFTVEMAMALLGGASITIACGGGGGSPGSPTALPTPAPTPEGQMAGVIAQNHGHEALITSAQLQAGAALSLQIQGSAGHLHSVELSADDVARIRAGGRVETTSTEGVGLFGPHDHRVIFN